MNQGSDGGNSVTPLFFGIFAGLKGQQMPVNLSDVLDGTIPVTAAGIEVELDQTNLDGGFKNTSTGSVYYAFDMALNDLDPSVAVQQKRGVLAHNEIVNIPAGAKTLVAKTVSGSATLQAVDSSGTAEDLGSGTMADQNAGAVDITGGTIDAVDITGGTVSSLDDPLAVADGGTGGATAADARTNLELGTIATQDADSVAITGGSVSGLTTPLAVADGGTAGTTAEEARDGLELGAANNVTFNDVNANGDVLVGGGVYANGGEVSGGAAFVKNNAEGNVAALQRGTVRAVKTLDLAATSTATLGIPSGVLILGVQICVESAISDDAGDDTWSAELNDGAQVAVIVAGAAAAKNTKVNKMFVPILTDATTNILFTPNGGSFAGGAVEIIVYTEELVAMGDAP